MKNMKRPLKIVFILFFFLNAFLSLYSISSNEWAWSSDHTYQKVLGTTSGFAAFTGVLATIKFYKRENDAFIYAIINGLLYGMFALSIDLTADFLVNIIWYIPIMFYFYFYTCNAFLLFHNPILNDYWSKVLGINATYRRLP